MRKASRENVFKLVFEYTFRGVRNDETLTLLLTDANLEDKDKDFITNTYNCVLSSYEDLKAEIASRLENYTIDRIYRPDLVIMIVALYELKTGNTPAKVVINEAVSLAKKYGTEKSGSFVNGVLAKFVK